MENVNLFLADLRGARLSRAKLSDAVLWQAKLQAAQLETANMEGANLRYADLRGANLFAARMARADLTRADMGDANVDNADATLAVLYGANLASSRRLTQQQVDSVWEGDGGTKLPESIRRPAHWPKPQLSFEEIDERLALHRAGKKPPPGPEQ